MNYYELQVLLEAQRAKMQYEDRQTELASHRFRAKQRRSPWIGFLGVLIIIGIVVWRLP